MNSKSIGQCENCGDEYCMECSDAKKWQTFCSQTCEDDHANDKEQE